MVLVDTSVLIDYFKGVRHEKTALFEEILSRDIPFGISAYTYLELLQGARDEKEFHTLKEYLSTQTIYHLPAENTTFEKAARLYFTLRRLGVKPRSTIDVLIALTAIENKLALLHHDRDFDVMAAHLPALRVLDSL